MHALGISFHWSKGQEEWNGRLGMDDIGSLSLLGLSV